MKTKIKPMGTAKHKFKLLLDADVLIHFIKAGELMLLHTILPEYKYVVVDNVYEELFHKPTQLQIDNMIQFGFFYSESFPDDFEILKEYAQLKKEGLGDGESACLAIARFRKDVLASSNLKDIKKYCEKHHIRYFTTMELLCKALKSKIFTLERCNNFIKTVLAKGSKLPVLQIEDYDCK